MDHPTCSHCHQHDTGSNAFWDSFTSDLPATVDTAISDAVTDPQLNVEGKIKLQAQYLREALSSMDQAFDTAEELRAAYASMVAEYPETATVGMRLRYLMYHGLDEVSNLATNGCADVMKCAPLSLLSPSASPEPATVDEDD